MAHFAEIGPDNTVLRVIVISNQDILDSEGNESEDIGIELCTKLVGPGFWKQTSFNNNFRKIFGFPGMKYSLTNNCFYNPVGPFPSWSLDDNYDWQAPIPKPADANWSTYWDEGTLSWVTPVKETTDTNDLPT